MEQQPQLEGPESYYCPISGELMSDPCIDPEGNTYDRQSIVAWLAKNATSPVTRSPLSVDKLAPNRALKEAIDAWKADKAKQGKEVKQKVLPKSLDGEGIKVEVEAFERKGDDGATHDVLVSVDSGAGKSRTLVDLACVIDISGSMQTEATAQNEQGVSESHGLSLLDIVKHAVATVIHSLSDGDRLSIVSYSDSARVELALLEMNESGKKKADEVLARLHTEGSTNLWDGLLKGMDVVRANPRANAVQAVFLLTDGQPNVAPPRGHLEMLKRYNDEHADSYCTINTFGFGYNLDSHLLDELATEGSGAYYFIPEATFVGTCFVNAMSNLLCVSGASASLSVENVNGSKITKVLGANPVVSASWGHKASLATVQYGQKRSVVLRMNLAELAPNKPYLNATLKCLHFGALRDFTCEGSKLSNGPTAESTYQYARALTAATLDQVMKTMKPGGTNVDRGRELVVGLIKTLKQLKLSSPNLEELLKDVEGQVTEATSKQQWWDKWGRHYLPSLGRAHTLQQCNNFKDPGVQVYGGVLFQKQRDVADAVFLKLPPPKPSIQKVDRSGHVVASAPVQMNAYYDSHAVCMSGDSLVKMADGRLVACDQIQAGDRVSSGARIRCVVQTACASGRQQLVSLSPGLSVTPWHPVFDAASNKWCFPAHLAPVKMEDCAYTYNFLLEENPDCEAHCMTIGGVQVVTLAHGMTDRLDDVRSHQYWGRDVLADLQQMPGFEFGRVLIAAPSFTVSAQTGRVCGLKDLVVHAN